jgi:hypothetical protein
LSRLCAALPPARVNADATLGVPPRACPVDASPHVSGPRQYGVAPFRRDYEIALAPHNQSRRLILPEEGLELQRHIRPIVVEQIHLNVSIPRQPDQPNPPSTLSDRAATTANQLIELSGQRPDSGHRPALGHFARCPCGRRHRPTSLSVMDGVATRREHLLASVYTSRRCGCYFHTAPRRHRRSPPGLGS